MGFAALYRSYARLEAGETLKPRTLKAIQHAFEKAGIESIDGNKPGVRVK
jgi:hypothetical protein